MFQASGTVAAVRLDLRKTRRGELGGHGVQHSDPLLHAVVRDLQHRLFQVADEQGTRVHHVPPLLRLRRRLANVRVRDAGLSGVGNRERARDMSSMDGRWTHTYGSRHRHNHRRRRVVQRPTSKIFLERRIDRQRNDRQQPS